MPNGARKSMVLLQAKPKNHTIKTYILEIRAGKKIACKFTGYR
jgi:hypothetical protein